jgi:hypothetical protein
VGRPPHHDGGDSRRARVPTVVMLPVGLRLLGLPEDRRDLVDLAEQLVGHGHVDRALGAAGAGQLRGLVEQVVQLRVLLEVRGLEVVGPQHPQVLLDHGRPLLLDGDGAGLEVGVVRTVVLRHAGLDRLGLEAGLSGVVHAAGQVAVGADLDGGGEDTHVGVCPFVAGGRAADGPPSVNPTYPVVSTTAMPHGVRGVRAALAWPSRRARPRQQPELDGHQGVTPPGCG